ncbi:2-nitropropane dioxygenase NPD [Flavobacteria bacterium MS024-3C]|jgi:nitronate monooxygenase|nr:2-nitropropane dioxygenase NPD [Flavobacteria bacterium MS024-3C]KRP01306.1 MAG: 2-nitropropane dioxygenase [Polaribacter sp. BACL8 MAG-120619-bin41]KRP14264.1 MAG: 2-nitropropane dioxygenase [Polaribacter sp. BACL8 MAG-120419-bin8]MBT4840474.1 nitronate monooxygenase [Flavobacteriaceae bacterium]MDA0278755.1 nitronate monooxygenase family protein [Bacteroidota bacterium]NQV62076.1 nitronate monooxygenase [Cryomorphaceae bacterium]|tara:strand:+ start:118 stop:1089 length:972 start_codon:yes stop_codon:yes gene_type:complete
MSKKAPFIHDLNLPVVAAPMFLISNPNMVIECCKNGIVGTFPALNQRTSEGFEAWLIEIKEALAAFEKETGQKAAPFGVNLIVHPTNPRLEADVKLCMKHKVPLVITSLGAVSMVVDAIHSYGGLVFHDIIKKRHAEKAAEAGVDGLILVAAGAGGHGGSLNPMSLVAEVKSIFDKTILLSGCISTGKDVATALQMGADLAYMGTRFINTDESIAPEAYKKMIVDAGANDVVYTAAISGVHANFLAASLQAAGITAEDLKKDVKIDFGKEMDTEAKAWKTIWSAGQGVTTIKDSIPVKALVERLRSEFIAALKSQASILEKFQ